MTDSGYEIAHFHPDHQAQVIDLLSPLWKGSPETRASFFRWKYLENPHADRALGIVALHKGRVIGFRGYFADRFALGEHGDTIGVLHPGDTCVDPAHRNKGLSVAMGNLAMQYDSTQYRLFMNMSCSKNSLPGYMAMGFRPLTTRVQLLERGRNPVRWALAVWPRRGDAQPPKRGRIKYGRSGNILVADSPLPGEMSSVISAQSYPKDVLRLHQPEAFFSWRYHNPTRRYVFYFLLDGEIVRAYVVVDISPNGCSGEIVDYGEREDGAVRDILVFMAGRRDFATLSVFGYGVDERIRGVLNELRFSEVHSLKTLFRSGSIRKLALPVLIRPVEQSYTEQAFMIGGRDLRSFASWRLKPICSDSA
jgi:GNAT superfamily N-acetyltransferase